MILRGDNGLLVAMGDDRDVFLDWLQSSGLNAVNATVVYYNTDSGDLTATIQEWDLSQGGVKAALVDENGIPVTRQENYVMTAINQRLLGRWLAYLELRRSEVKTFIRDST